MPKLQQHLSYTEQLYCHTNVFRPVAFIRVSAVWNTSPDAFHLSAAGDHVGPGSSHQEKQVLPRIYKRILQYLQVNVGSLELNGTLQTAGLSHVV